MHEVGRPPRRSKAAVLEALKEALATVKLPKLNRERLVEFDRQRAKEGAGPAMNAVFRVEPAPARRCVAPHD
jgi:hypothetical protein